MKKTILINIQIDEVKAADLAEIEELLEQALKEYTRKTINFNLTDTLGPSLPIRENDLT